MLKDLKDVFVIDQAAEKNQYQKQYQFYSYRKKRISQISANDDSRGCNADRDQIASHYS
jgi:hypothetical protein